MTRPEPGAAASAVAAIAAIAALALPAIRFPDETLSGFRGLDALSLLIAVILAFVIALAAVTAALNGQRLPAAACLTGVFAGNVLIQRFTTRGTLLDVGLWWATALAAASAAAALVDAGVRGPRESRQ